MAGLYAGTILRVDLGEGSTSKEPTSTYSGDFLGGRGINAKILYDEVPPEIEPLDPASLLIFGVGPLCGTPVPSGRTDITFKSPETGFLGSSNFGGYFGPELKFAGYDHIVIAGRTEKPVYLWIHNDQVEIRDASHLWGKDTYETQDIIRTEIDPEAKIACIGPAGENLVRFATVQSGLGHSASRTGPGCVMGSKNLKAIVVRGTKEIALADPVKYLSLAGEVQHRLINLPGGTREVFKYGINQMSDKMHDLSLEKMGEGQATVRFNDLNLKYKPKKAGCFGCPIQCMDLYPVKAKGGGVNTCGHISHAVFYLEDDGMALDFTFLTQKYGVDAMSTLRMLVWLMELHYRSLITAEDTDGISMEQKNPEAWIGMLKKIVCREGIGDVLADGMLSAVEKIGRGYEDPEPHLKGLPFWDNDTHDDLVSSKGTALSMVMSSRGDAMKARARSWVEEHDMIRFLTDVDEKTAAEGIAANLEKVTKIAGTEKAVLPQGYEGKPELVVYSEDSIAIYDCLSTCKWISAFMPGGSTVDETYQAALFSAGTGIETSADTLFEYAGRIRTLERAFCAREGMTRETDSLPKGIMDRPVADGPFKGEELKSSEFEKMKDKYYTLRGWDVATGIPTRETLEAAGLGDVARDLEKRGKLPKSPTQVV